MATKKPAAQDVPEVDAAPVTMADAEVDAAPVTMADASPVTMADASALNGVDIDPPDESPAEVADVRPFISAGMASDLENQGWTLDPTTGKKIVKE